MNEIRLKKSEVIDFFNGGQRGVAEALGINQSSVSDWPETLSEGVSDRVRGAATRLGMEVPASWRCLPKNELHFDSSD